MTFDKDQLRKTAELQKLMRDPAAVRALIAENERLFKLLERTVEQYVPLTELEGVPGWSRVVELVEVVAQRDQLRAEVAGLRTGYEAYEQVNAELRAENEALREEVALGDKIIADRDRLLNMFDCPAHGQCIPYAMEQIEALRKDSERLQSATAFVQKLCDSAGKQPSVATGYLHDILAALGQGEQS